MAGFLSVKMKRKDLEEVNDDFSEFSLSSPARKIRRLDAELPPIMEEEEPAISITRDQQLVAPVEEPVPYTLNEERALVLYKPVNAQLLQSSSSSNLSFRVNTDLIPGLKNQVIRRGCANAMPELMRDEDNEVAKTASCLAVVPWAPPQYQHQVATTLGTGVSGMGTGLSEPMEAEATDVSSMEVEEENVPMVVDGLRKAPTGMGEGEGLQQWQQHCMTLQLPQNASTPIMWTW
eukprot:TRINITY_DN28618_c0_g1_i1.p1 TRINITY_DN28618_c0_g1~~TRINITY_DN28618_c0_g1_i1.p1  ORF type:complete len:234 (+),score=63.24 TRINITY_DN28618_c0_g1_i1:241-942(+)